MRLGTSQRCRRWYKSTHLRAQLTQKIDLVDERGVLVDQKVSWVNGLPSHSEGVAKITQVFRPSKLKREQANHKRDTVDNLIDRHAGDGGRMSHDSQLVPRTLSRFIDIHVHHSQR